MQLKTGIISLRLASENQENPGLAGAYRFRELRVFCYNTSAKCHHSSYTRPVKILKVLRKKNESELCLYEVEPDFSDPDVVLEYLGVPESSYVITWAFHSYILKTMFLHEWFEYPEDSHWTQDKLGQRIHSILERIFKSLSKKDIRSFWLPEYKLFNFRARRPTRTKACEDKLSSLITNFAALTVSKS